MARISLQEAYDQARRWIESDDPERAIGLAQHILTQFPDNLEAFRILGEAHIADRQLDQAQAAFERVLQSDPENVPAHVGLGIAHERQGRLDRAIPEFEQAWEIKPEMTELRSQLLRLYADAWGSEHAQLRLRGGGLARLYAKGHMLPQAIAEFRKVIDDQPERADAKVALAEALWRNGQEDDARDLSRQLLGNQSKLLKPNLLLGYIELASGSANGQHYWDTAHTMDPYETVAQAMFETLPSRDDDTPMIEEWDEQAWRELRQQEQQELDATRPIPVPSAEETDAAGDSWLDRVPATVPPPPPRNTPMNPADNDDFLAGLLGMPEPASMATASDDTLTEQTFDDEGIDVSPFSFNEFGLSDDEIAGLDTLGQATEDAASSASTDDETDATTPFSAADLGLSDDDITGLDLGERADDSAAQSETVPEDESTPDLTLDDDSLEPFSLAELGLSEGEISDLDAIGTSATLDTPDAEPVPSAADDSVMQAAEVDDLNAGLDSGSIQPFSFADLGLSDDEIAALDLDAATADESAADPDAISEDFVRGQAGSDAGTTDETASTPPAEADDLSEGLASGSIQPFSFADLGLSDDELAALDLGEDAPATPDEAETSAPEPTAEADDLSEGLASGSIQPFSFADLGLSDDEIASLNEIGDAPDADAAATTPVADDDEIEAHVQPFSLSDLGLSDEELDNLNDLGDSATDTSHTGASFGDTTENEYELPADLQPFSLDELDISGADASDFNSAGLPTSLQPFSLDELPESPTDAPKRPEREESFSQLPDAPEEETSQQTGGYSWQEPLQRPQPSFVSSMNKEEQGEGASIFAKLKQRKQEEPIEPVQDSSPAESDVDDRLLFSFDNVSLRDGESGDAQPSVEQVAPVRAATESETAPDAAPQKPTDSPENIGDAVAAGEIQPFSLSDLGLSEEEIAALGLGNATTASVEDASQPAPSQYVSAPAETPNDTVAPSEVENLSDALESGTVQPFSFADLGLSEDEIAGLDLGEAEQPSASTASDESSFLADFNLEEAASAPEAIAQPSDEQQDALEDDIQPFSLNDLGFSDDELDAFGVDEPDSGKQSSGLDLTEEDLAGLDFGTPAWMSTPQEQQSLPADAPASETSADDAVIDRLITLGQQQGYVDVSDIIASIGDAETDESRVEAVVQELQDSNIQIRDGDEIIDLSGDEELDGADELDLAPSSQASPDDEADLTPFSLAELGLSDDEIASLGLADVQASPAASPPESPPAAPESVAQAEPGMPSALAGYMQQLESDPQNHILRLSIARAVGQAGMADMSVQQYRHLIKQNALLDVIVDDIRDLLDEVDESSFLQRLHRLLGDAYAKQGRLSEAMTEYAWVAP